MQRRFVASLVFAVALLARGVIGAAAGEEISPGERRMARLIGRLVPSGGTLARINAHWDHLVARAGDTRRGFAAACLGRYRGERVAFAESHPVPYGLVSALRGVRAGAIIRRLEHQTRQLPVELLKAAVPVTRRSQREALFYGAELAAMCAGGDGSGVPVETGFLSVAPTTIRARKIKGLAKDLTIAGREIFVERRPAHADGRAGKAEVLIAPGYGLTGREYYALMAELRARDCDCTVFDQQWAGYTRTRSPSGTLRPVEGDVDSDFGMARDAMVNAALVRALAGNRPAILLGESDGARAIYLGMQLADLGLWDDLRVGAEGASSQAPDWLKAMTGAGTAGPRVPRAREAAIVPLAMNAGIERSGVTNFIAWLGSTPVLRAAPVPLIFPSIFSHDPGWRREITKQMIRANTRLQARALLLNDGDTHLKRGAPPRAWVRAVHSENDSLASSAAVLALLGPRNVELLPGANHLFRYEEAGMQATLRAVDAAIAAQKK